MSEVRVIGGGPAGSTFAARMAQLGHRVTLVERARFPRAHLGESLSPGVLPLLEITGARQAVEQAGFPRVKRVHVRWESGPQVREDAREEGLLVDRGRFDLLLLERARALGVQVLFNENQCPYADFIADARGRSSPAHRKRTGCRTIALYAYWRGPDLPREPRIEAGKNAWYWGVPLPDDTYNTLAFVDTDTYRAERPRFKDLLNASGLLHGCCSAQLQGSVQAIDATSSLDEECVTPNSIRVGEAALALDPISSSGVQKSIQSALAAAVTANTLLRRPDTADAAMRFYRDSLAEASERHCRWAVEHYATAAARLGGKFWEDRARPAALNPPVRAKATFNLRSPVALSALTAFLELPCIEGEFVVTKPVLCHPNLNGPIAYLGAGELPSLLRELSTAQTPLQIAQSWQNRMPFETALGIAAWLCERGVLTRV